MSTLRDKRSRRTRAVRRTTRAALGLLAVSAVALGTTACDDDGDDKGKPAPAQSSPASDGGDGGKEDGAESPDASAPEGGEGGKDSGKDGGSDSGEDSGKDKPSDPSAEPTRAPGGGGSTDNAGYTCENLPPASKIPHVEKSILGFLRDYKDAQLGGTGASKTTDEVRAEHILPDQLKKLEDWEKKNDADGVFRGQNVPNCWDTKVLSSESSVETRVQATFHWGEGEGEARTVVVYETKYWEKYDGVAIANIYEKDVAK